MRSGKRRPGRVWWWVLMGVSVVVTGAYGAVVAVLAGLERLERDERGDDIHPGLMRVSIFRSLDERRDT
jgi:hypothetical protein